MTAGRLEILKTVAYLEDKQNKKNILAKEKREKRKAREKR